MAYIHPTAKQILDFSKIHDNDRGNLASICEKIFAWFDSNIAYSRLNAPFFPLQRNDLDVLFMHSGTCGDYSNLLVSTLLAMGFEACYAYVHKDCYGDQQDHICAAVKENNRYILIDATQPYRKWFGFDCPHQDVELLSPSEFEHRMKKEEHYWYSMAEKHNKNLLAGLLYAPWIHAECVFDSRDRLDHVFFLLVFDKELEPTLYVYYQHDTKQERFLPVMATISKSKTLYHFSIYPCDELWDNAQWSNGFPESEIPEKYISEELQLLKAAVLKIIGRINDILHQAGCQSLI